MSDFAKLVYTVVSVVQTDSVSEYSDASVIYIVGIRGKESVTMTNV